VLGATGGLAAIGSEGVAGSVEGGGGGTGATIAVCDGAAAATFPFAAFAATTVAATMIEPPTTAPIPAHAHGTELRFADARAITAAVDVCPSPTSGTRL
jgi:hypothetical protein